MGVGYDVSERPLADIEMAPTNYSQLEAALEEAAFEAVRRVVHAHSSEGLYCVALYTSGEYRYAYDTANSAKGLSDLVEARLAQDTESDMQSAMAAYKWSPCDWPYHLAHEHLFQRAYELLEEIWASVEDASDEEADQAYIAIHGVFVSVLRKVWNSGVVPDDCLVMLLAGDQSDEARIVNAEEINDLSLVARFLPDFDPDAGRLAMLRANRWPQRILSRRGLVDGVTASGPKYAFPKPCSVNTVLVRRGAAGGVAPVPCREAQDGRPARAARFVI